VKTLYILRHAKSSWEDIGRGDHDRPLAPRGRRAAKKLAKYMRRQKVSAAMVLCSSATRTRETLALVSPVLGAHKKILIEDGLYAASADELLDRLHRVPDPNEAVMLIGHNPGVQELALTLTARGAKRNLLMEGFPTAGLATLRIDVARWRDVGAGDAELVDYVVPREL
jgi:phosphohistidine phosphatase